MARDGARLGAANVAILVDDFDAVIGAEGRGEAEVKSRLLPRAGHGRLDDHRGGVRRADGEARRRRRGEEAVRPRPARELRAYRKNARVRPIRHVDSVRNGRDRCARGGVHGVRCVALAADERFGACGARRVAAPFEAVGEDGAGGGEVAERRVHFGQREGEGLPLPERCALLSRRRTAAAKNGALAKGEGAGRGRGEAHRAGGHLEPPPAARRVTIAHERLLYNAHCGGQRRVCGGWEHLKHKRDGRGELRQR